MFTLMNRRKAIVTGSLAAAGLVAGGGGYKWYRIHRVPELGLLQQNGELLAALAETIIPTTDTPGARETGVADFIVKMIRDCTDRKEQNRFIEGLKTLQQYCLSEYGRPYEKCKEEEQEAVLTRWEQSGKPKNGLLGKVETRFLGRSFFTLLKEYTAEGYCTSQPGATKGLAYLYIPGSYKGCSPLKPGQKAWATN